MSEEKKDDASENTNDYPEPIHIFEHAYTIGRKYLAHIFKQDARSKINQMRLEISTICHFYGESKSKAMIGMLEEAIAARMEIIGAGGAKKKPQPGEPGYTQWMIVQELARQDKESTQIAYLQKVAEGRGFMDFDAWAVSAECSQHIIDQVKSSRTDVIGSKSDLVWLEEILSGKDEMSTAEIRALAEDDGIVAQREFDPAQANKDWGRISKAARRERLHKKSARQGYWKW